MNSIFITSGFPLQDLIFGASVYFPPLFKGVIAGFFIWLLLHRAFRGWIYSGEVWNPTLLDVALFCLSICFSLALLTVV